MAQKLSWTQLRRALATRALVSEKTAGVFLNTFVDQLIEALKTDKQVKINGLGTFKLQPVAPRKSVNISTGEQITIEGYNKIVFTPEIGVKELVEKNQATPPQTIDPIQKLGEQATEIVDLLADLGQKPNTEKKPKKKKEKPTPSLKGREESASEEVVEEQPVVEAPTPVAEAPTPVVEVVEAPTPVAPKKEKKVNHFFRDLAICLLVMLMIIAAGFYFFQQKMAQWLDTLSDKQTHPSELVVPAKQDTIIAKEPIVEEEPIAEEPVVEEPIAEEPVIEEQAPYAELITIEPMHEGSRLTWMSKRYYGDKRYWPYLYDANRDVITNPGNIAVGTPIRVPKLTAEQKDTTNATTRARLEQLLEEALAASH